MSANNISQLPLEECRYYIRVVLNQIVNVLDCLSFSERLKAHHLVAETAIYLSPHVESIFTFPVEHYIKVFLKKRVSVKKGLALNQELKANALVQAACFRSNTDFDRFQLLRMQSKAQKYRRYVEEMLALLQKQKKERE